MKTLIVTNAFLTGGEYSYHAEWYKRSFEKLGISAQVIANAELSSSPLPKCDFVFMQDKDILLAKRLEADGVKLYNSAAAIETCDSKALTCLALRRGGVAQPQTVFAPMTYENVGFTSLEFLDGAEQALGYPMVVKEVFGSFGSGVYLAADRGELERIVAKAGTKILFQRFIEESFARDVRAIVAGGRVIASVLRRNTEGDFRSNVARGAHAERYELSDEQAALAVKAAESVGALFAGVDLLLSGEGSLVCEVNSNAHMRAASSATGIDTALEIARAVRDDFIGGLRDSGCEF